MDQQNNNTKPQVFGVPSAVAQSTTISTQHTVINKPSNPSATNSVSAESANMQSIQAPIYLSNASKRILSGFFGNKGLNVQGETHTKLDWLI